MVGNSACEIAKESDQNEIKTISLRFKEMFPVIKTKLGDLIKWNELSVINCTCNLSRVHQQHSGSGTTAPFVIDRIESHPAICMQIVRADIGLMGKVVSANDELD